MKVKALKKVCVVVASRANYGRVKTVMQAIKEHPALELQVVAGASALLKQYGKVVDVMEADGFTIDKRAYYAVEGDGLALQAKTTGLGIVELSGTFEELKPDYVLTVADRFETMATAIAAAYMNIPLIHLQGGEVSGNIDDRVRHAISKLSDLHFPCTEQSRERLIRMGENPDYVFNHGCPAMDVALSADMSASNEAMAGYAYEGYRIDWMKPYILLTQHPVTTSFGDGDQQILQSLQALLKFQDVQKVILYPNIDAGSDHVANGIRTFRSTHDDHENRFAYYTNFNPQDYVRAIANAKVCVGNSSSFIREGAALGIPVVLVGDRQIGREQGVNTMLCGYDSDAIEMCIEKQLAHGPYERASIFGHGDAGKRIADTIAEVDTPLQKKIMY